MIVHPRIGMAVRIHYRKSMAGFMPHHGKRGVVVAKAKGPGPRNHCIELECGTRVSVPCGNIIKDVVPC